MLLLTFISCLPDPSPPLQFSSSSTNLGLLSLSQSPEVLQIVQPPVGADPLAEWYLSHVLGGWGTTVLRALQVEDLTPHVQDPQSPTILLERQSCSAMLTSGPWSSWALHP